MSEDKGLKQFLMIFNGIVVLAGLALVGVGVWVVVDSSTLVGVLDNAAITNSAYGLIVVGAFIALVGFCGCCGAWKQIKCLLIIYLIVVGIMFLFLLAVAVVIAVYQAELETFLEIQMNTTLQESYGVKDAFTETWDTLQLTFSCCGTSYYTDYETSEWYKTTTSPSQKWPGTCCKYEGSSVKNEAKCYDENSQDWHDYMNTNGCYNTVSTLITDNITIVGAVLIGLCVIIICGLCAACCMYHSIGKND
ncbi:tetraspanin-18-like [Saccoglossus kowalevskii]|uniref:Tetraspanin n=1 Tax=Saccoglossus kowalevskii TaxID=10224 RepID=A0ABM0GRT0_SACKO|nr:PREDICTED: tetraspanin-18-like [Saccoglossus kowalevskii]